MVLNFSLTPLLSISHPGDDTNTICCTEENWRTPSSTASIITDSAFLLLFSSAQLLKASSQDKGRPGIAVTPGSDPGRQHGWYCTRLGFLHLCSSGSDTVLTAYEIVYRQSSTKMWRLPVFSQWSAGHCGTVVYKLSITKQKVTLSKIAQQALLSQVQCAVQWNPRYAESTYFML